MKALRTLVSRTLGWVRGRRLDRELDEELRAHLDLHIADGVRQGLSPADARRHALLALGGIERTREDWRDRRGLPFVETTVRDIRFAVRMLWRHKGWSLTAITLMGLAVGANTAVYSAAHASLFARLNVANPETLVAFKWYGDNPAAERSSSYGYWTDAPDTQRWAGSFSYAAYTELARRTDTLTDLFAFGPTDLWVSINGSAEAPLMQFVSGNYYQALGVRPHLGRLIAPADEAAAAPVAVISEAFWRRRFDSQDSAVGASLSIGDRTFTVIGVVPEGVTDLYRANGRVYDVTIPLATEPSLFGADSKVQSAAHWWLVVMGRRRAGVSVDQVQAELTPIFTQVAGTRDTPRPELGPLHLVVRTAEHGAYDVRPEQSLRLTLTATFFAMILIVVTANIANLVLFRGSARAREFALRAAIGCSRRRLIRQLLTENLVLAAVGGGVGLGIAAAGTRLLPALEPSLRDLTLSRPAVGFAALTSLLVAVAIGLLPALRLTRRPCTGPTARVSQPTRSWIGRSLVAIQVALSLVLLIVAMLFVRTLDNLRSTPSGFRPDGLVYFRLNVGPLEYSPEHLTALRQTLLREIQTLPDVRAAALTNQTILTGGSNSGRITLDDGTLTDPLGTVTATPAFFDTMGIPITSGRGFLPTDYDGGPPVAVVSQAFADRFFPDQDPLGHTFQNGFHAPGPIRIVGIAADVKHATLRAGVAPIFYLAARRDGRPPSVFYVRAGTEIEPVIHAIQALVARVDPALPQQTLSRQTEAIANLYQQEWTFAVGASLFGGLALVAATIGVFGLMSYAVARRTKEIAIRLALGASRARVFAAVVRETLSLVGVGVVLGLVGGWAVTRVFASALFGLSPTDPLATVGAVTTLLTAALVATWLPARAAARVDPMAALRLE